ncbi:pneumococcal serine-rich repeat protein isoform X4 [Drosophila willistoni]|uniref:pneumococcal serine-rich repeat protein isoform X4 n=1 Tax=Drosophila willistoni TaxID=7260 RepID=UPI000C26C1F1|nr:pneumococcal serine-rich repeat protein isoform X4 [Drosophila willistoni]
MEVATTNNHSHHLQADGGGGVGSSGSRSPFQREVREWQRIDPQTGALFSGRLEADRWINGPLNSYGKISDSQNISQPNGTQHTQRKQLEVLQARTANGAMQVIRTQTVQKTSSTSRWSSTSTSTTTRTANSSSNGWAQFKLKSRPSQSVDICELSDGDGDGDDDYDDDADAAGSSFSGSESTSTLRHDHKKELVDDHVDFVVINGQSSDQDDDGVTDDVAHLHKLGHNLLPDTAPSLKLSNLMKSSSSISSQSSNNSNLTTATATAATMSTTAANTHRSAGKISLHAIVEPASASASASSSAWPKQADLYGQSNRRVGVPAAEAGAGAGADVVVGTPTQRRRDLESFRHDNGNEADDDLRLSARHQRRQQVSQSVYAPPLTPIATSLQRSRSISTDDLSNEWDRRSNNDNDIENEEHPGEWRRVSKLRRSFQSQDHYKTPTPAVRSRPLDLPSNSVSVARMRAELENRRRLHTAMRNNHVDLAALDTILNSATPKPTVAKRNTFLTAESLQEIRGKLKKLSDESLYKEDFLAYQARKQSKEDIQPQTSAFRPVAHNTHSLESRQRQKDTNSSEWHLRRKSYGFEKMAPPEDKSIFRVDASTDSGLGRSGEQLGNWSPTERERERAASAVNNGNGSGTIIHFSRQLKPGSPQPSEGELSKRHSIAVEETWRDIRKTSQVHVNGENITSSSTSSTSHLQRNSAQKRVEFCKTEVHFAAESGRVNIVETDGKPPPTQNFRRRRRTASGPLQSLVKAASASPSNTSGTDVVTHFGDDSQRRKTIVTSTVAYRATLMEPPEVVSNQPSNNSTQVTVTIPKPIALETRRFSQMESTSRNSYTSTSGVDTTDNETDELANIRGILKNKPVKPKPYHLGENIESADVLWSVPPSIKSDRESPAGKESATIGESPVTTKSVAERIRIVEQRQHDQQQSSPAGNGYSTKINVSLGAEDNCPNDSDLPKSNVMNIALHSPRVEMPKVTPPTLRIGQLVPVAKPRTLFIQPQPQPQTQHHSQITENNDESGSESLKIVKEARGARKLREHELSYFGVQQQQQPKVLSTSNVHMNPRRSLPSRSRVSQSDDVSTTTTTKWQLLNDRPDLLRHSPQGANDNDNHDSNNIDDDDENDGEQEHCYENIANELTTTFRVKPPSPSNSYERKSDLQRDAQILSEMTHNADQTMKALSDEAAIKDQRRRRSCSLQRRQGKPLETIDEKVKIYNSDRQHSSSVTRGTFASEARRNSRQSTPSPTPRARSSSQSSIECCPRARSRSSSRESMTQGGASSDDQTSKPRVERLRMRTPKREKLRQDQVTEHRSRHSSKQKSSASALPESTRRIHHHSRHRSGEQEHSGEGKNSSSTRLMRSSRVSDENRPRSSTHRISDRERERERSRVSTEKHREELTRSRGHSSRSRHTEEQLTKRESASRPIKSRSSRGSHDTTTTTTTTTSSAHKKPTTSNSKSTSHKVSSTPTTTTTTTAPTAHNELTYVYVTNLANTQTIEKENENDAEADCVYEEIPQPPPRRKRKNASLIPVPVQRVNPLPPPPPQSYEHRTKLEMIPPSYSNQSTLRCRSMARRKPSLKATQSTSSSFAFLPYLPAKRNSSVSHVYDNYLLYSTIATPATAGKKLSMSKLRPYQNNLSNEHAQLFGGPKTGAAVGRWPKRLRMRQVRSSVSTHQPFGICTCS